MRYGGPNSGSRSARILRAGPPALPTRLSLACAVACMHPIQIPVNPTEDL